MLIVRRVPFFVSLRREWEAAEKLLSVAQQILNTFTHRDLDKISL